MENEEFIREFLEESEENLDQLDQDFVSLEQHPGDLERLDSIYRAIHTIKGTSGFFGFSKLGAVAHAAENLLSRLRDGEITLTERLTSALLDSVDAIRDILSNISKDGGEGEGNYRALNQQLDALCASAPLTEVATDDAKHAVVDGNASHVAGSTDNVITDDEEPPPTPPAVTFSQPTSVHQPPAFDPSSTDNQKSVASSITTAPPIEYSIEQPTADLNQPTGEGPRRLEQETNLQNSTPELAHRTDPTSGTNHNAGSEGSIRVDVGLLNQLMDLVGELVLARNQLLQTHGNDKDSQFSKITQQVNRITTELQERVMQTRMQPIGNIWGKFPRLVRDLAVMCGKEIDLGMHGAETEVDKSLLEAIKDPLTHLIRNAIDHGIETAEDRVLCGKHEKGQLHLRAWHQGGKVNIEITDDGRGIDAASIREKAISKNLITPQDAETMEDQQMVQLIFRPGFSTAQEVTGISGRGVGMDVVKTNIESIGGTIEVQSRPGTGTAIKVKIPLTLAIVPALIISSNNQLFAIPQSHLVEMLRLDLKNQRDRIEHLRDTPVYRLRGELLPLVGLRQLMGTELATNTAQLEHVNIVVLQADNCRFGLIVDHVERTEEIVVKALHSSLGVVPHFAGATVMGDGRVALILDVLGLATDIGLTVEELQRASELIDQPTLESPATRMLIFRVSSGRELAMPLSEIDRIEEVPIARIEQTEKLQAVQYRGQIMPLLPLSEILGEPGRDRFLPNDNTTFPDEAVKAIVVSVNGAHTALAVRDIVDVAAQEGTMRVTNNPASLVRGAAVINGKVTDVLDLQSVLHSSGLHDHSLIGTEQ